MEVHCIGGAGGTVVEFSRFFFDFTISHISFEMTPTTPQAFALPELCGQPKGVWRSVRADFCSLHTSVEITRKGSERLLSYGLGKTGGGEHAYRRTETIILCWRLVVLTKRAEQLLSRVVWCVFGVRQERKTEKEHPKVLSHVPEKSTRSSLRCVGDACDALIEQHPGVATSTRECQCP